MIRPLVGRRYVIFFADGEHEAEFIGDAGTAPGLRPDASEEERRAQPGIYMFRLGNDEIVHVRDQHHILRELG